ncbi:MAG: methylmalonyl Co-A mutase-associated GTPase MeaB [Acidimicrobiia bacterium]
MRNAPPEDLLARAREGQRGPLARLLSLVERGGEPARRVGRLTFPLAGSAHTIGLTGAPGAGKSTLTSALVAHMRSLDVPAAVLAIDPSSPFTGGAILGDRVRMVDHALDAGVFIRSMATRGQLGGLALATPAAVRVLDAVGFGWVLIETVGVGQVEVEIAGEADTTVVVVNPGWGDSVQANKAGLMEIADIFVINKADRPGVADTRRDLEQMLELSKLGEWIPPIVATVAHDGQGADQLWDAVQQHRAFLERSGEGAKRRARRLDEELRRLLIEAVLERADRRWQAPAGVRLREEVAARRLDPYRAAEALLGEEPDPD